MKKVIYALILPLVVVSGLVFANREVKDETSKKSTPKPLSTAEREAEVKKWEATPDGIKYKEWEASPAGKKVYAAEAKIRKHIKDYTNMEGVVTSLSLPPGCSAGENQTENENEKLTSKSAGTRARSSRASTTSAIGRPLSYAEAISPSSLQDFTHW